MSAQDIQAQIERCLRLAEQIDDPIAQQQLLKLADDYRAKAAVEDQTSPEFNERDDPAAPE